jgi:SAM-dependent methyltransferase
MELSPAMIEIARTRARELGLDVDLRVGDAQALDLPDESFDTVVCTLSLCTIPNHRAAVAEVRRVLRPGGRFLLLEHVRSPVLPVRLGQRLLDPPRLASKPTICSASRSCTCEPRASSWSGSSARRSASSSASRRGGRRNGAGRRLSRQPRATRLTCHGARRFDPPTRRLLRSGPGSRARAAVAPFDAVGLRFKE